MSRRVIRSGYSTSSIFRKIAPSPSSISLASWTTAPGTSWSVPQSSSSHSSSSQSSHSSESSSQSSDSSSRSSALPGPLLSSSEPRRSRPIAPSSLVLGASSSPAAPPAGGDTGSGSTAGGFGSSSPSLSSSHHSCSSSDSHLTSVSSVTRPETVPPPASRT